MHPVVPDPNTGQDFLVRVDFQSPNHAKYFRFNLGLLDSFGGGANATG